MFPLDNFFFIYLNMFKRPKKYVDNKIKLIHITRVVYNK